MQTLRAKTVREIVTGWISTETFLEGFGGLKVEAWGGLG